MRKKVMLIATDAQLISISSSIYEFYVEEMKSTGRLTLSLLQIEFDMKRFTIHLSQRSRGRSHNHFNVANCELH